MNIEQKIRQLKEEADLADEKVHHLNAENMLSEAEYYNGRADALNFAIRVLSLKDEPILLLED